MRITTITVTDDSGVQHTWEGLEGFLHVHAVNDHRKDYQQAVDAHLVLPARSEVKA